MYIFNTGSVICVPTRDNLGNAIATPTPVKLMTLQDIAVEISADIKTLHGEKKFAVAAAQGKGKIEVKGKYATINPAAVGLFMGTTAQTGLKAVVLNQAATIPAGAPYTRDVGGSLGGGTFLTDLGVYSATTGVQFTRVASGPTAGQYSLNVGTGVYTFAAADANAAIVISFEYSANTGGKFFNIANEQMGYTPKFQLVLQNRYDGETLVFKLNNCTSSSFSLPMKNEDFAASDFNATAMEDAAGNVGYISLY
jgi:hypothetical protein